MVSRSARRVFVAVAVLLAANTLALPSVPADPVVDDFGDGTVTDPSSIVLGLDGAMWFTATQNRVGAVTPDGAISSFGTGPSTYPKAITIGPDGNRWFVSDFHAGIGRATPEGAVTWFPNAEVSGLQAITTGPDGNLWFTAENRIGRIDPDDGSMEVYSSNTAPVGSAGQIVPGPGGALWFHGLDHVGRITTAGDISRYAVPLALQGGSSLVPVGDVLWFTTSSNQIARLDPETGVVTGVNVYPVTRPHSIDLGPDGALWFTGVLDGLVGRYDPRSGDLRTFETGANLPRPAALDFDDDERLWFTDASTDRFGRLDLGLGTTPEVSLVASESAVQPGHTIHVTVTLSNPSSIPLDDVVVDLPGLQCGAWPTTLPPGGVEEVPCTHVATNVDLGSFGATLTVDSSATSPTEAAMAPVQVSIPAHGFADIGTAGRRGRALSWAAYFGIAEPLRPAGDTFGPGAPLLRKDLVLALWHFLDEPPAAGPSRFTDVPPGARYRDAATWASSAGLVPGSGTRFGPRDLVPRGQLLGWVWRMAGRAAPAEGRRYTDVAGAGARSDASAWTSTRGLFDDVAPGPRLQPDRDSKRLDLVLLLRRLAATRAAWSSAPDADALFF